MVNTQQTIADDLGTAIMMSVARRIVRTSQTDPAAAQNDYEMHASALTIDERADFDKAIVQYAIEIG